MDPQNQNAKYLDKFGTGTSSVRIHAPPGGKSSFSFGWVDDEKKVEKKVVEKTTVDYTNKENKDENKFVKVKQAPGGTSQIKFG